MKAFVNHRDYVFMLERGLDDINRVQQSPLEAEILNEKNFPTGKRVKIQYEKETKKVVFVDTLNLVRIVVGHQIITSLIHSGFYGTTYDEEHSFYITDGIPPSRFI